VQLTIAEDDETTAQLDLLLAKKRAPDRKAWLEAKGNLADVV
jgi:topoisomerase-4 subunit B